MEITDMLYAVHCTDGDAVDRLRERFLAEHKQYLRDQSHMLVVGGALLDEAGQTAIGSLYIVNAPDRRAAEAFSNADPFTRAGVFATVKVTAMRKSHFNPGAAG